MASFAARSAAFGRMPTLCSTPSISASALRAEGRGPVAALKQHRQHTFSSSAWRAHFGTMTQQRSGRKSQVIEALSSARREMSSVSKSAAPHAPAASAAAAAASAPALDAADGDVENLTEGELESGNKDNKTHEQTAESTAEQEIPRQNGVRSGVGQEQQSAGERAHRWERDFATGGAGEVSGVASVQGLRKQHEDAYVAVDDGALGIPGVGAYGVFDGFGGSEVSSTLSKLVLGEVQEAMREYAINKENPSGKHNADLLALSMRDAFLALDKKIVDTGVEAGSTLVMLLTTPTHLVIANVGDSRLVLSSKAGRMVFATKDHKPTSPKEFDRIVASKGGFVEYGRVKGILAVARAFGACEFKDDPDRPSTEQAVSPEPDLFVLERDPSQDCCILGSDGLWDVFSVSEAVNYVLPVLKPEVSLISEKEEHDEKFWAWFAADNTVARTSDIRDLNDLAYHLCVDSLKRGATDNVTSLIIRL